MKSVFFRFLEMNLKNNIQKGALENHRDEYLRYFILPRCVYGCSFGKRSKAFSADSSPRELIGRTTKRKIDDGVEKKNNELIDPLPSTTKLLLKVSDDSLMTLMGPRRCGSICIVHVQMNQAKIVEFSCYDSLPYTVGSRCGRKNIKWQKTFQTV